MNRLECLGICPKCYAAYERPASVLPNHPGYFCPNCREKGYTMIGIINFVPDIKMNIWPAEVTTA